MLTNLLLANIIVKLLIHTNANEDRGRGSSQNSWKIKDNANKITEEINYSKVRSEKIKTVI